MTAPKFHLRFSRCLLWLAAVGCVLTAGCRGSIYDANGLPSEFQAPTPVGVHTLDLSSLSQGAEESSKIYVGDLLDVTVTTGLEERQPVVQPVRVAEDGTINLPLILQVRVAGLELNHAEQVIRQASIDRGIYRNPHVSVILNERRTNRITVMGAVEEPAVYELPAESSDLLAAIVAAGGLNEEAGTIVEVRRPGSATRRAATDAQGQTIPASYTTGGSEPSESQYDLASLTASASTGEVRENLRLQDGSVVMVRPRAKQSIQVIGLVRQADRFELPADEEVRLLDAIALAGGRTLELADDVKIIRQLPDHTEPIVIEASVRDAKRHPNANIRLAAGDIVSVEETALTFTLETLRQVMGFGFSSPIPGI